MGFWGGLFKSPFAKAPLVAGQSEVPRTPSDDVLKSGSVAWSEVSSYLLDAKYNPDDLIGRKGFDIYKRMMFDEQVKSVMYFKRSTITGREYYFELDHAKYDISQSEAARRVDVSTAMFEDNNYRGTFVDGMNSIMKSLWQGFSMTEQNFGMYEYAKKMWWGLRELRPKPFDTFFPVVNDKGDVLRWEQRNGGMGRGVITLDMAKFVYYRYNPDVDEHYGGSDLRAAYRAFLAKDIAIRYKNIYMERFAAGFAVAKPADGNTLVRGSPAWNALTSIMSNITGKSSIILPEGVELEIVHPTGNAGGVFKESIEQDDQAIARAALVPNLIGVAPSGQTGSYSQSDTQFDVFMIVSNTEAQRLQEALNEQIFAPLGRVNFPDGVYPKFCFKPLSKRQIQQMITAWQGLVSSKAVQPSDTDEAHIRKVMEFPEKGEVLVDPSAPASTPPASAPPSPQGDDGKRRPAPVGRGENSDEERDAKRYARRRKFHGDPDDPDYPHPEGEGGGWSSAGVDTSGISSEYAVSNYTSVGYNHINRVLRDGEMNSASTSTKQHVAKLDQLIAGSELGEDTTLYRVIDGKRVGDKYLREGSVIEDAAFMSTSTKESHAMRAVSDTGASLRTATTVVIAAPRGAKAYSVNEGTKGIVNPRLSESEVLLPRNTALRITRVDRDARVAYVEIVRRAKKSRRRFRTAEAAYPRAYDPTVYEQKRLQELEEQFGPEIPVSSFFRQRAHLSVKRDEALKSFEVTQEDYVISMDDLIPTQEIVQVEKLYDMLRVTDLPPPRVMVRDGSFFLLDGHHRVAMESLRGQWTFRVTLGKVERTQTLVFERASRRVAFAVIGRQAETEQRRLVDQLEDALADVVAEAVARVELGGLGSRDSEEEIGRFELDGNKMRGVESAVRRALRGGMDIGNSHAKREVESARGKAFSRRLDMRRLGDMASDWMKSKSFTIAGDLRAGVVKQVKSSLVKGLKESWSAEQIKQEVYRGLVSKGILGGRTAAEALSSGDKDRLAELLEVRGGLEPHHLDTVIRTNMFEAINEARLNTFTDPEMGDFVVGLEYSAILDSRTTAVCEHMDGRAYSADRWQDDLRPWVPPNHFNCRSILVPITKLDEGVELDDDLPRIEPQEGF